MTISGATSETLMRLVNKADLDRYLADDAIGVRLRAQGPAHEDLVCHKWLLDSPAKRHIYQTLYGDLLDATAPVKLLDVGGGITGLTPLLARKHDYRLIDPLAHGGSEQTDAMTREAGRPFLFAADWYSAELDAYDLVIANDLFPNVDQRLALFIDRYLPRTRRLRLSLTYYDTPRFYLAKRIDADEIFCMLAWDSRQLKACLEPYTALIVGADLSLFDQPPQSVFPNGRQVCVLEMKGGLDV